MVTKTGEMRLTKETERGEKQQNCVRRRIEKDKKREEMKEEQRRRQELKDGAEEAKEMT